MHVPGHMHWACLNLDYLQGGRKLVLLNLGSGFTRPWPFANSKSGGPVLLIVFIPVNYLKYFIILSLSSFSLSPLKYSSTNTIRFSSSK